MSKSTTSKTDKTDKRLQNLKPIKKGQLTKEEAKRRGSNGGKMSGKVRQERKLWKEEIEKRLGQGDFDEIITNLIERAKVNPKDFETLRDTMGQKPSTDINITTDADEFEFNFKYSK